MSKELKAPDKVTQKMTRDGAVAENLTTGETSSISERPQEENYSAPAGVAAEKVVQHIGAEIERHAAKGAEKKALDATQPKTHSSRLQFSEAERATPELQKAIKKSDKAADCLDAARAAIPKQTKIKKERVFDEAKGKAKTRLSFEKTDKPPNGKLRHNPLSRPAQELNSTVHGKIYEVEKENVGVESGHRVELAGEKAGGMAARFSPCKSGARGKAGGAVLALAVRTACRMRGAVDDVAGVFCMVIPPSTMLCAWCYYCIGGHPHFLPLCAEAPKGPVKAEKQADFDGKKALRTSPCAKQQPHP